MPYVFNPFLANFDYYQAATGGSSTFVNNEIVSGSGTSWTLSQAPLSGVQEIYGAGIYLMPGADFSNPNTDYTISGQTITTRNSYTAGTVVANYQTS